MLKNKPMPFLHIALLLTLVAGLTSCAVNPVSGEPQLMLLTEADEVNLGRKTDREVLQQYGAYEDQKLTAYANDYCRRIGSLSHRPQLTYHFKVLDSPVVNAFAVPGGYVYFTRGILAHLNSEAELAGVMGHEIGHITARHSAHQVSRSQLAQVAMGVGMIISDTFRDFAGLAQFGVGMLFLKFSRDNEREADDLSVEYATKAGYDAAQVARFFETLERLSPGSDRSGLPDWFSTHPNPEDRIGSIRSRSREWQERLGIKDLRTGHDDYLRQIDGLVYGEDPRQGYVENEVFYHPLLRFQFPVPAGWKINNTRSQVQMVSKAQDGAVIFAIAAGAGPRDAARAFVEKSRARVLRAEDVQIDGLGSYRVLSDIASQRGTTRVLSCFIQKEGHVYVFHGLSSIAQYDRFASTFWATMGQFKRISDQTKIDVKPERVRVRNVGKAGTVEEALRSLGVQEKRLKETAVLNGKSLQDRVDSGTLLKIVEKGTT